MEQWCSHLLLLRILRTTLRTLDLGRSQSQHRSQSLQVNGCVIVSQRIKGRDARHPPTERQTTIYHGGVSPQPLDETVVLIPEGCIVNEEEQGQCAEYACWGEEIGYHHWALATTAHSCRRSEGCCLRVKSPSLIGISIYRLRPDHESIVTSPQGAVVSMVRMTRGFHQWISLETSSEAGQQRKRRAGQ